MFSFGGEEGKFALEIVAETNREIKEAAQEELEQCLFYAAKDDIKVRSSRFHVCGPHLAAKIQAEWKREDEFGRVTFSPPKKG
jgi:hypothetical protein